jgi:hypothetical protein
MKDLAEMQTRRLAAIGRAEAAFRDGIDAMAEAAGVTAALAGELRDAGRPAGPLDAGAFRARIADRLAAALGGWVPLAVSASPAPPGSWADAERAATERAVAAADA